MKISIEAYKEAVRSPRGCSSLSVFVFLHNSFPSGRVRQASARRIASICGISWSLASKDLAYMAGMGWIRMEKGDLVLMSLKARHKRNMDLSPLSAYRLDMKSGKRRGTIKELGVMIKALAVRNAVQEQAFVGELLVEAAGEMGADGKPATLKTVKRARKKLRKLGIAHDRGYRPWGVSQAKLTRILNCSLYMANKVTKAGEGIFYDIERRIRRLPEFVRRMWCDLEGCTRMVVGCLKKCYSHLIGEVGRLFITSKGAYWAMPSLYTSIEDAVAEPRSFSMVTDRF